MCRIAIWRIAMKQKRPLVFKTDQIKGLMQTLTLTIKKQFFNSILNGAKTSEYRIDNEYYRKVFSKKYTHLKLHYYRPIFLLVEINKIIKKKTPKKLKNSYLSTENIFEIKLGKVICKV